MNELKGKVVIITGGASGIGLSTVEAFLAKGSKVVLSDYDVEEGEKQTERLKDKGEVVFIQADVSKEEDVKSLIEQTAEKFGSVDVLFNNAGVLSQSKTHELSYEEYSNIIKINQDGVFFGSKYGVQQMLKNNGGVIINCASILGSVGEPTAFAYNASKGAVVLMTKSLALQYGKDNIRCAAVGPAYTESGMVNKEALGAEYYDALVDKHPIGRLGQPEEIAHAVVFIAENQFVTGTTIFVDGGYTSQ
ncbi:MAG: glucose 1-dehydrogenase [Tetragenococcus halophilus]|nr:glucose 1-dehydrogenase [Tetragenococcus halophilus]MDN6699028.1 glucose 1-dehydrogenase [Staphylococcus equorum]